jgi:hypothetical protein
MVRQVIAASAALIGIVAYPVAATAAADEGQLVSVMSGSLRCLVSADDVSRGGGPMVVCQRSDGQAMGRSPFAASKFNEQLPLVVMRGTGEFHWAKDTIALPPGQGIDIGSGQTYQLNGWTIQPDPQRTRFTYDATGHGMLINAEDARSF